ncbi:MAG: hypothetical protein ACTTKM_09780 [Prevotella fusca]
MSFKVLLPLITIFHHPSFTTHHLPLLLSFITHHPPPITHLYYYPSSPTTHHPSSTTSPICNIFSIL